jgi:hypothetical protein
VADEKSPDRHPIADHNPIERVVVGGCLRCTISAMNSRT